MFSAINKKPYQVLAKNTSEREGACLAVFHVFNPPKKSAPAAKRVGLQKLDSCPSPDPTWLPLWEVQSSNSLRVFVL